MADEPDPFAAAMALLLGADAARIVRPAAPDGSEIRSLRPRQVLFRLRHRVAVTYRAELEWRDGRRRDETIVASASEDGPPHGALTSVAGEQPVAVWRAPQDPLLPGLGRALDPLYADGLLADAGVRARKARVTLRAYRPGGRAVVEVRPVEPERSESCSRAPAARCERPRPRTSPRSTSRSCRPSAPPRSPTCTAGSRRSSRHRRARSPTARRSPARCRARRLARLVPAARQAAGRPRWPTSWGCLRGSTRPGWRGGAKSAATRAFGATCCCCGRSCPRRASASTGCTTRRTVRASSRRSRSTGTSTRATSSSATGRSPGLPDVDDAGLGERVEDLGLLIGRLWSLRERGAGKAVKRYTDELLRRSDALVDPGELRRRVGVALVGRATAPFRNQLDDWRAETRWRLESAERCVASVAAMLGQAWARRLTST